MTMTLWPLTFEIIVTFVLSAGLLYRYGNWSTQNIITIVSVFVAWFFSFIVIFILPLDISTTAYRQCLYDAHMEYKTIPTTTTTAIPSTPESLVNSSDVVGNLGNDTYSANITNSSDFSSPNIVDYSSLCMKPWSYAPNNVLVTLWKIVYWTGQVLTWIILPLMQSYAMSGEFTVFRKLKSAFVENAIYYGSFAVIFVLLFIYVAIHTQLEWAKMKVICITASNTWGLLLLVVLLGYGLVEIPRSCFNNSQHSRNLSYLYFKVAKLSAEKCEADEKLDDTLEEIQGAYEALVSTKSHLKPQIEIVLEKCPVEWRKQLISRYHSAGQQPRGFRASSGIAYNDKSLIRMHQTIIKAQQSHFRTHCQWNITVRDAIEWEDVARNETNPSRTFKPSVSTPVYGSAFVNFARNTIYTPTTEWYWKCLIRGSFYRFLGYILTIFTLMVIWSELVFSIQSPTLSIFAGLIKWAANNHNYFFIETLSIGSIAYLSICAYYTVFKIRIFNYYYLAPHHQTDEYSLIFCGMLLCRLTPPLCLNFLGLIHLDTHVTKQDNILETAFTGIMGHMDVVSIISDGFNLYLPIVMCIFCLATFFQFGSRLLHLMGIEQFISDDDMTTELIREGQDLVKREKNKRQRQMDSEGNRERWTATTNKFAGQMNEIRVNVDEQRGNAPVKRTTSEDSAKCELLNDVEPVDYSTTWSTGGYNANRPPKGLFDDI